MELVEPPVESGPSVLVRGAPLAPALGAVGFTDGLAVRSSCDESVPAGVAGPVIDAPGRDVEPGTVPSACGVAPVDGRYVPLVLSMVVERLISMVVEALGAIGLGDTGETTVVVLVDELGTAGLTGCVVMVVDAAAPAAGRLVVTVVEIPAPIGALA